MSRFKTLRVWNNAVAVDLKILEELNKLNSPNYFELKNQIRRASISISSNIAEGSGRHSDKDYIRFLRISLASSMEVESQLFLLKNTLILDGLQLDVDSILTDLTEIQKQLRSLINYLNGKSKNDFKPK
jgi:four helix bundle protein